MKRIGLVLALVISTALVLAGCTLVTNILDPLPEEYIEGIKVPREFPKDDFEIYEDSVVFDLDEDDEEMQLKYGTTEDLDDIIEYYEDLFEDEELIVEKSEEEDDEYYAKGMGETFRFEINAEPAKGNYEERVFTTVVEIYIEQYVMGTDTLEKMQGFWHACGENDIISDATKENGNAMEFDGMAVDIYDNFAEVSSNRTFEFIKENVIEVEDSDGGNAVLEIVFETIDGIEVMTLTDEGDAISFQKSSYNAMLEYQPILGQEILAKLQGFWLFCGKDGEFSDEHRSSGWGVDFDGMLLDSYTGGIADYIDSEIVFLDENTITYLNSYGNQTTLTLYVEEYQGKEYMTLYFEDTKYYYEHSSYEEMLRYASNSTSNLSEDEVYLIDELTDADMEYLITDADWYMTYYYETDGSYTEGDFYNRMYFESDYTAEDEYETAYFDITWAIDDELLYLYYEEEPTEVYMLDFEYDGAVWYMYLFDADERYDSYAYVFTMD